MKKRETGSSHGRVNVVDQEFVIELVKSVELTSLQHATWNCGDAAKDVHIGGPGFFQ